MKLDIGCGPTPQDGYTGVDAFATGEGITNADMWALPYGDGTVEQIVCSHALEHIAKRQVVPTLTEWLRVLEPGGEAVIAVPDLEWCCKQWLEHKTNDWWLDIIFGNQDDEGQFHKTGFTDEIMVAYLTQAGFAHVTGARVWMHQQQTLIYIAVKAGNDVS